MNQITVKNKDFNFSIIGNPPKELVKYVADRWGSDDDELIPVKSMDWYKEAKKRMTPGLALKIYRENLGLTQGELGVKLGGIPKQNVCNMEKNKRGISKDLALKMAALFDTSVSRFI